MPNPTEVERYLLLRLLPRDERIPQMDKVHLGTHIQIDLCSGADFVQPGLHLATQVSLP